jgi:hypothetical protein
MIARERNTLVVEHVVENQKGAPDTWRHSRTLDRQLVPDLPL